MITRATDTRLRWAERALFVVAAACVMWVAWVYVETYRFEAKARASTASARDAVEVLETGAPIGTVEIPRVGLFAAVAEGDDDGTLRVAVGHLPDTPLPWQGSNAAFAGHRDVRFRALKDLAIGDEILLSTIRGRFVYRVERTRVVDPSDLSVLGPTSQPTLTLITCYPFSYVGRAPLRFVVTATRQTVSGGD